jgi:hypothetical protein
MLFKHYSSVEKEGHTLVYTFLPVDKLPRYKGCTVRACKVCITCGGVLWVATEPGKVVSKDGKKRRYALKSRGAAMLPWGVFPEWGKRNLQAQPVLHCQSTPEGRAFAEAVQARDMAATYDAKITELERLATEHYSRFAALIRERLEPIHEAAKKELRKAQRRKT